MNHIPHCRHCDEEYLTARWALGYKHCIPCAEKEVAPTRTIVPMAKSNYILVTDLTLLKGLNKYASSN
jgi:hypothetical protein